MSKPGPLIAVFDVGKTNAKLALVDPALGQEIWSARRANEVVQGPACRELDIAGIEAWLMESLRAVPERERIVVMVLGYLLAPLLLVIPLMVSAVLAADAFAGEKERRTLESLLHLPIADRDLFVAKVLGAFVPAVLITWVGSVLYVLLCNVIAWPVLHRPFLPFAQFTIMILWVAPAVAMLALGLLVIVSSRARTTQEANQLGGAVILPLIFIAAAQASTLLLAPVAGVLVIGALIWVVSLAIVVTAARRFTRDRLAAAS